MGQRTAGQTIGTAEQMSAWCALFEGCERIGDVTPRQPTTVLGVVQRLRFVPGESMEAVVTDGSARLRAIFTGGPIDGLELGQGLRLEGTVCLESGMAVMRNPSWRIVRDPYACQAQMAERQGQGGRRRRTAGEPRQPISA